LTTAHSDKHNSQRICLPGRPSGGMRTERFAGRALLSVGSAGDPGRERSVSRVITMREIGPVRVPIVVAAAFATTIRDSWLLTRFQPAARIAPGDDAIVSARAGGPDFHAANRSRGRGRLRTRRVAVRRGSSARRGSRRRVIAGERPGKQTPPNSQLPKVTSWLEAFW